MKALKDIIAANISDLRKQKKWTQFELAEKLNFTDKAISKWERGESTPDVNSLLELANLFEVTVDYFFHEDSKKVSTYIAPDRKLRIRNTLILCMVALSIFLVATVIFVGFWLYDYSSVRTMWVSFVWCLPVLSLTCGLYFRKQQIRNGIFVSRTCLLWTLLTGIYLTLLVNGFNLWMLFIVGIPIQGIFLTLYLLKSKF